MPQAIFRSTKLGLKILAIIFKIFIWQKMRSHVNGKAIYFKSELLTQLHAKVRIWWMGDLAILLPLRPLQRSVEVRDLCTVVKSDIWILSNFSDEGVFGFIQFAQKNNKNVNKPIVEVCGKSTWRRSFLRLKAPRVIFTKKGKKKFYTWSRGVCAPNFRSVSYFLGSRECDK